MAERSDTELFRAITTQRSEAALEQLFRRYFSRLCEFAFRLSASHAAAEELVSDLFYKLYADGAALGVPENVAAYLFAATRRRVLNHRRDSGRRARAENLAGESEDAASADGLRLILFREMETEIDRLLQSRDIFPDRCHLVGVYALGKCQRLMALLRAAGYDRPIYLHGALLALTRLYVQRGLDLGNFSVISGMTPNQLKGEIVLCPPSALSDRWSRRCRARRRSCRPSSRRCRPRPRRCGCRRRRAR